MKDESFDINLWGPRRGTPHPASRQENKLYPASRQENKLFPASRQENKLYPAARYESKLYPISQLETPANRSSIYRGGWGVGQVAPMTG